MHTSIVCRRCVAPQVLREVDFIGAIDCASRMSEDLYGVLRQQVAILDALTFTSAAHRQKDFEQLSANGITCARAHHRFDEIAQTIQRLVHAHARCHPLHPVDNPPNSPDHKHIRELIYKFQMRFTLVYRKLHTALRSAEVRVPKDLVKTWIVASVEPGECCTICMCEVEEEEVVLKLPCKHAFHQECIAKWLHWNTVCPNCRHPMSGMTAAPDTPRNIAPLRLSFGWRRCRRDEDEGGARPWCRHAWRVVCAWEVLHPHSPARARNTHPVIYGPCAP